MITYNLLDEYRQIADNSIKNVVTWDDMYKAVRVTGDTSSRKSVFYLYLGKLSAGQVTKFSLDYMAFGSGISIKFNRYSTNIYTNETNVVNITKVANEKFDNLEYTFSADVDAYYRIEIGSPNTFISDFYIRDLVLNKNFSNSTLTQRLYEFTLVDGVITTGFIGDEFTLVKGTIAGRYTLTYGTPFGKVNSTSGTIVCKSGGNPNRKMDCLARGTNRTGCTLQFLDTDTDTYLSWEQVSGLTGTYYFSVVIFGYDR